MTTMTSETMSSTKQFRCFHGVAQRGIGGYKCKLHPITRDEAEKLYSDHKMFFWSPDMEDIFPDGWNCSFIWGTEKVKTKVLTDPFDGSRTVYTAEPFGEETSGAVRFWKGE